MQKVRGILEENNISYEVLNVLEFTASNNNYELIKKLAYQNLDKEYRVNEIVKKINNLNRM